MTRVFVGFYHHLTRFIIWQQGEFIIATHLAIDSEILAADVKLSRNEVGQATLSRVAAELDQLQQSIIKNNLPAYDHL